jgi:DNA-binding CsgD family transcriptional regulator
MAPDHSASKPTQDGQRELRAIGEERTEFAGALKEEEAIADLCSQLEAGFDGSDVAVRVLESVIPFIGAESASLRLMRNGRSRALPFPVATVGIPDIVGEAYRERFHKLDPVRWKPPCRAAGPIFADPDRPGHWLDTRMSRMQTSHPVSEFDEYRRAFLEPYNLVQHVGFCFEDESGNTLLFDFHRGRNAADFGRLENARARFVACYLYARLSSRGKTDIAPPGPEEIRPELSARELEVATKVSKGLSNKEVAAALDISVRTVENHMRSIFTKLGIGSRTHLAAILYRTLRRT